MKSQMIEFPIGQHVVQDTLASLDLQLNITAGIITDLSLVPANDPTLWPTVQSFFGDMDFE